jgi:16S rRNA (guanine966-N2)-methyltransferase
MRVIAGQARGRKLVLVPGDITRPITDRAKEALFGILGGSVVQARVLDLFAGTGSVGIEALSRGAGHCDFVEWAPAALKTIHQNLDHTGLAAAGRVVRADTFAFLRRPPARAYDLVYIAPPQYRGLWRRALDGVDADGRWVAAGGRVVVQIDPREEEDVPLARLVLADRRKYGNVLLLFYRCLPDAGLPGGRNPAPAGP